MKRINMKKTLSYLMILVLPVILISCYPGGAEYVDELDVVGTKYDEQFDFSKAKTYALPDTIYEIKDSDDPSENVPVRKDLNKVIVNTIVQNMTDLGYTRLTDTLNGFPDVFVMPFVTSTTYVGYNWYPYWGWGWGWGWYYPPGWGSTYSYETGTLFIDMLDSKSYDEEDNTYQAVWHAGCNGLVQGSDQYKNERVERMINQSFEQSPYLKAN